jgi:ligand-binding sensor domain-containing protein
MKWSVNLSCILLLIVMAGCKKSMITGGEGGSEDTLGTWVTYTTLNSGLPDNQVNTVAFGNGDEQWAGTSRGLVRIKKGVFKVFNTSNSQLPSDYITSLAVEKNGTVWVGTSDGLARYNGVMWEVFNKRNSVLPDNEIMCIAHDPLHHITWIGTPKGLVKANAGADWELNDDIEDDVILSMATDRTGTLWMGTFNHIAFRGRVFRLQDGNLKRYQLADMGYSSAFPYAVAVNEKQDVLVAMAGTVVKAVIRFKDGGWQEVARPEKASGLRAMVVQGDQIWVGGNTLAPFGDKANSCISIPGTDSPILSMAIDSKGRKWMGTVYGGLAGYRE